MAGKLDSIQALRALAAIAVVSHHAFLATMLDATPPLGSIVPYGEFVRFGASGVDVFFIISGFLMMHIAEPYFAEKRKPSQFFAQRVIRVWPPYATATLLACAWIFGTSHEAYPFDLHPIRLASILFVPSFNSLGRLQPIIGPGWTLNYEMLFYGCFSIVLYLGRRFATLKLMTIIVILYVVGRYSPNATTHAFLGDPIIFEFVFGSVVGSLIRTGSDKPWRGLVCILLSAILALSFCRLGYDASERVVAYGIPAVFFFIGVFSLENSVRWPKYLILLGDASYSIYLTHTLVIYHFTKPAFWMRHHAGGASVLIASWLAVIAAVVAGLLFYGAVERPLLRASQNAFNKVTRRKSPPPMVAA